MAIDWRLLLAGAAVIFLVFLVVKMRPVGASRNGTEASLRDAKQRAREAKTPREKAEALCQAGVIVAGQPWRISAAGYFLRAMRADPAWPGAIEKAAAALQRRRPRVLERVLWRRLADVPWDDAHREAILAAATSLRDLYRTRLRDRPRAEFLARFMKLLE